MTTVLVADDTPSALILLTLIVESLGCEVLGARDGVEALGVVETAKPDIAFVDLSMPNMDGFDTIKELRRLYGSTFPVYAVSAHCKHEDLKKRALTMGAEECICKPIEIETIEATLRRHHLL